MGRTKGTCNQYQPHAGGRESSHQREYRAGEDGRNVHGIIE